MSSEALVYRLMADKKRLEKDLNNAKGSLSRFQQQSSNISRQIKGTLAGMFAVGTMVSFGKSVIETTAKFQKMEAVLSNTLGSGSEAQKAMQMITEFASKTPFQVDGLTGAFVKLANQGFVPTSNEMRKLGDLAASTGKDFDQLAEAVIDAQVGEFERLKEFGIRSQKEGDKVRFTFKGVETQVNFTDQAIRDYILSLGDATGVSGSMAAISETVGGKISNLEDNFTQLKKTIGDQSSGVIAAMLDFANTAVSALGGDAESQIRLRGFGEAYDLAIAGAKEMTERLKGQITEQTQLSILIKRYRKEVEEAGKVDGEVWAKKQGILDGLLARQKEINDAVAQEAAERQRANKAYQDWQNQRNNTLTNRQSVGVAPQAEVGPLQLDNSYFEAMQANADRFKEMAKPIISEVMQMQQELANAFSGFGVAVGSEGFQAALERAGLGIADTIGDQLIKLGLASKAMSELLISIRNSLFSGRPELTLGLSIAAIAAGAALKAAVANARSNLGGGGSGGGSRGSSSGRGSFANNIAGQTINLNITGELKGDGKDLVGVLNYQNKRDLRTQSY
ncbi:hypothetical protein [Ekhidna sp.]|uniref:hypothetical protein n=1 Tax=Ekhidna sp. TaxID=2608089 RepID=UPI003C7C07FF